MKSLLALALLLVWCAPGCALVADDSEDAVIATIDNPPLEAGCGLDVVLVLDASASVRNYNNPPDANGAVDLVAGAANAFLNAFANTDSRVGVVSYNANPITHIGLTDVNTASLASGGAHAVAIGDPGPATGPVPRTTGYSEHARVGSGTNWEAGLAAASSALEPGRPDVRMLVVHVSDGRPTRHLDDAGNVVDTGTTSDHVAEAAVEADALKARGVHLYSVGIGRADAFVRELQAVSGPDVFVQADPADTFDAANDDVILASDFAALEQLLVDIAGAVCTGPGEPGPGEPGPGEGVGTPGYWSNKGRDRVPAEIFIGDWSDTGACDPAEPCITLSRDEALAVLGMNGGDKRFTMARSLAAAWLNITVGHNDSSCIAGELDMGVAWLQARAPDGNPLRGGEPVQGNDWGASGGEAIHLALDEYNNTGAGCAPDRDDLH